MKVVENDLKEIFESSGEELNEKLRNKSILVSGAYGMLASYFVYYLIFLNEKYGMNIKIWVIVRSKEKCVDKFWEFTNKTYFTILVSDLKDAISINDDIDYIVHAASITNPSAYSTSPVDVIVPNILGTYRLLELAKEKNTKGFMLFSTADIYGLVDETIVKETSMGVMDPLDEHNCYGESKRLAETLCMAFWRQYSVPIKIARIWHTYAPTMDILHDNRVFSAFVKNIIYEENIEIKSDGKGERAFCYITDAVVAFLMILLIGKDGESYNICNEDQISSIEELAKKICDVSDRNYSSIVFVERPQEDRYLENIFLHKKNVRPCSEKLRQLGWMPHVAIEDGFERVMKYQRELFDHKEMMKKI